MSNKVSSNIKEIASGIYKKILSKKQPDLVIPLRSLSNVEYNDDEGYFKLLGKTKTRTLTKLFRCALRNNMH